MTGARNGYGWHACNGKQVVYLPDVKSRTFLRNGKEDFKPTANLYKDIFSSDPQPLKKKKAALSCFVGGKRGNLTIISVCINEYLKYTDL